MSPSKQRHRSSTGENKSKPVRSASSSAIPEWITESTNGGSLRRVDPDTGTDGWASPPGDVFSLRSDSYLSKKQKTPAGDYLLSPAGMDWLKSSTKLVTIDMGFLAEAQTEEELPERLIGAVRVCQMEMSSAFVVDAPPPQQLPSQPCRTLSSAKVNHDEDED